MRERERETFITELGEGRKTTLKGELKLRKAKASCQYFFFIFQFFLWRQTGGPGKTLSSSSGPLRHSATYTFSSSSAPAPPTGGGIKEWHGASGSPSGPLRRAQRQPAAGAAATACAACTPAQGAAHGDGCTDHALLGGSARDTDHRAQEPGAHDALGVCRGARPLRGGACDFDRCLGAR